MAVVAMEPSPVRDHSTKLKRRKHNHTPVANEATQKFTVGELMVARLTGMTMNNSSMAAISNSMVVSSSWTDMRQVMMLLHQDMRRALEGATTHSV